MTLGQLKKMIAAIEPAWDGDDVLWVDFAGYDQGLLIERRQSERNSAYFAICISDGSCEEDPADLDLPPNIRIVPVPTE